MEFEKNVQLLSLRTMLVAIFRLSYNIKDEDVNRIDMLIESAYKSGKVCGACEIRDLELISR